MTLPHGSTHLAASADFTVQAFRMKEKIYGLLFYLELEEAGIETFLCREYPQDVQGGRVSPEIIQARSSPSCPRFIN